jgi:hypothetical protein
MYEGWYTPKPYPINHFPSSQKLPNVLPKYRLLPSLCIIAASGLIKKYLIFFIKSFAVSIPLRTFIVLKESDGLRDKEQNKSENNLIFIL